LDGDFWSWFAGFWEGEGSFYVALGRTELKVSQKNEVPLQYIKAQLGLGSIYQTDRKTGGKAWQVGRRPEVLRVIAKMLPHLRFRKNEVIKKLNFLKANPLKISSQRRWKQSEIQQLIKTWTEKSDKELTKKLNRTPQGIIHKRLQLRLLRQKPIIGQKWSNKDVGFLSEEYLYMNDQEIGKILGRTPKSIVWKRWKLNLKRRPSR